MQHGEQILQGRPLPRDVPRPSLLFYLQYSLDSFPADFYDYTGALGNMACVPPVP